jgi:hypothetical protein
MRLRQLTPVAVLAALLSVGAPAESHVEDQGYSMPAEVTVCLGRVELSQRFTVDMTLNPFYLRGDFDNDGKPDYLVRVVSSQHSKRGLIACWGKRGATPTVIGAGRSIPSSINAQFDDLPMIGWYVYGRRPVEQGVGEDDPPRLRGEAVVVHVRESASGILYWTGKAFRWYQQGD